MIFKNPPKILAIIPARGGSKGIPKKNLYPIGNPARPLIDFTILAATRALGKDNVLVSSDNEDIMNHVWDKCYVLKRSGKNSTDMATCEDVVMEVLTNPNNQITEGIVILLQPTSPLRTAEDIETALDLYLDTDAISLVSVCMADNSPLKHVIVDKNGFIQPISKEHATSSRQSLPYVYKPNGAIYITTVENFLKTGSLFSDKTIPYLMETERSIDVDTMEDIKKVEEYLLKQK